MRVLALLPDFPDPPINGSRIRNYFLYPELKRQGIELKILGFNQDPASPPTRAFEGEFFKPDRWPLPLRAIDVFIHSFHHRPRSKHLEVRLKEILDTWHPDILHAEELRMGKPFLHLPLLTPFKKTCTFYNVESQLLEQTGSYPYKWGYSFFNSLHLRSCQQLEKSIVERLDLGLAYSEIDKKRFESLYPNTPWITTRNGAAASQITPKPQASNSKIFFVGSLHYHPNLFGLHWFIDQVLPKLPAAVTLTIAGSKASPDVKSMLCSLPRVQFLDTPPDLNPLYADHALSIVPLFHGGGTRTKILESLAHERLVIATPIGAEGLELESGDGIEWTEDASLFAQKIDYYLTHTNERAQAAARGRKIVLEKYDWSAVAQEQIRVWENCLRADRVSAYREAA